MNDREKLVHDVAQRLGIPSDEAERVVEDADHATIDGILNGDMP